MFVLFWAFVLLIFSLFWLASLAAFLIGKTKKLNSLKTCGGFFLASSSFLALFYAGSFFYGEIRMSKPSNVYETMFGFSPTPDVTNLQSSYSSFGDSDDVCLRFQASSRTVQRIVQAMEMKQATAETVDSQGVLESSDAPVWWKPLRKKTNQHYTGKWGDGELESKEAILVYEPNSNITYFRYVAIY